MAIDLKRDGLTIGNQIHMTVFAVDADGDPIPNLSLATEIYFMIKQNRTDADNAAIISKLKADMTINDTTGEIEFFINSPDWFGASPKTPATEGDKPIACQVNFSTDNKQELYLKIDIEDTEFFRTIKLTGDVIRG